MPPCPSFPATRLRRLRRTPWMRTLVAETRLAPEDLIWPCFVQEGEGKETPVPTLPGVSRYSIDRLIPEVRKAAALGIQAIALFPVTDPSLKTPAGDEALNPENLICRAVRALKQECPDTGLICDVALDPYTTHGHDGVLTSFPSPSSRQKPGSGGDEGLDPGFHRDDENSNTADNDRTVALLAQQAVVLAAAGADIVAPSDMMDGRVGAIRAALDGAGHTETAILSYAAKYASAFYGPFREAVGSKQAGGTIDKRGYQMDPANRQEALREVGLDIAEGADMVMVKPGLPYLDIIRDVADSVSVPVFAYHVSGEYAMLRAAAQAGSIDYERALMESLTALKRAGCRGILTYGARDAARLIRA